MYIKQIFFLNYILTLFEKKLKYFKKNIYNKLTLTTDLLNQLLINKYPMRLQFGNFSKKNIQFVHLTSKYRNLDKKSLDKLRYSKKINFFFPGLLKRFELSLLPKKRVKKRRFFFIKNNLYILKTQKFISKNFNLFSLKNRRKQYIPLNFNLITNNYFLKKITPFSTFYDLIPTAHNGTKRKHIQLK